MKIIMVERPSARLYQAEGSTTVRVYFNNGTIIPMIGAILTEETADDILIKSAKPRGE